MVRLILIELVDLLGETAVDEQTLPSGDRVSPDDRVRVRQVLPFIIRRSSVLADRDALVLGLLDKEGRRMERRQTLEELLVVRRESVVCLVSRTVMRYDSKEISFGLMDWRKDARATYAHKVSPPTAGNVLIWSVA
jgi:hypothetical protein